MCYTSLLLERVFEGAFAADVVVGLGAGGNVKKTVVIGVAYEARAAGFELNVAEFCTIWWS